jgi:hypothetical protein
MLRAGRAQERKIREIAAVIRAFSTAREARDLQLIDPPGDPNSCGGIYRYRLQRMLEEPRSIIDLADCDFKPFLVMNGFLHATQIPFPGAVFTLARIADALDHFTGYLAYVTEQEFQPNRVRNHLLEKEQKRFQAFCIAQLIECGMDLMTILITLKGDALDYVTSMELRECYETPGHLMRSKLFTDTEHALFRACLEDRDGRDWGALQSHFVRSYHIPFTPAREV